MSTTQDDSNHVCQKTIDYRIAMVWNDIVNATDGTRLKDKERELWKMGGSVSGWDAIVPQVQVSWRDDNQDIVGDWSVMGHDVWFPITSNGYRQLWKAISCDTIPPEKLEALYIENPALLKKMCNDVSMLYIAAIDAISKDDSKTIPNVPSGILKKFMTKGWMRNLAGTLNMKTHLAVYMNGTSAEDIVKIID